MNLLLLDSPSAGATVTPAPAFHRDGRVFRMDDGAIFPWAFGSEFPTLRMFLDGVDLAPLYADRYAVGQRGFSFFVTSEDPLNRLGEGGPYSDQQILDGLARFVDVLRERGFNSEACVFQGTDHGTFSGSARQAMFWSDVLDIAKVRPWMSVSFSKEWWKQSVDWTRLRQPTDQTWDGGGVPDLSGLGLEISPGIWVTPLRGSHDTFQASRNDEWPRKTKSAWEIAQATRIGCVTCEPMGADETNQPGRRSNVPHDFFWSAAIGRLMSLGCYFHSQAGATGAIWGPVQWACASRHFDALSLIPPDCQLGAYAKSVGATVQSYDDMDGGSLRTYGMRLSDHEEWTVVVRPGTRYPRNGRMIDPAIAPGWTARQRLGVEGTVLQTVR